MFVLFVACAMFTRKSAPFPCTTKRYSRSNAAMWKTRPSPFAIGTGVAAQLEVEQATASLRIMETCHEPPAEDSVAKNRFGP